MKEQYQSHDLNRKIVNSFSKTMEPFAEGLVAYRLVVSGIIPLDKFDEIKKFIEHILNGEHICKHCHAWTSQPDEQCYNKPQSPTPSSVQGYTREQVIEIIKECANKAECNDPYQEARKLHLKGDNLDGYIKNNPATIDKQSILNVISSLPTPSDSATADIFSKEPINFLLVNALRVLDKDKMQVLTQALAERCGLVVSEPSAPNSQSK